MHNLFGTDGIRTRVGITPLTPSDMMQLGKAIGVWITQKNTQGRIILGHDTRHSGSLLKNALKAGLLQFPITVYDAQIVATPTLFYHTTEGQYDFGVMLTASHNHYQDNGIKIFTHENGKLTQEDEQTIMHFFYSEIAPCSYENIGTEIMLSNATDLYLDALKIHFPSHFLEGVRLVIDCANGSYAHKIPLFLKSFGAEVIAIATEPDGKNINANCGSLHPKYLQELVKSSSAHAGFAFDGDGDRLIAIGQDGRCKDGDEIIGFLLSNPMYDQTTSVVGTVLSNQGLQDFVEKQGKTFYRTAVGDKLVIEKMKTTGAFIGGEPSGHIILKDFTCTADGLFTLLQIAYTACLSKNWSFNSFTKLPQAHINMPALYKKDLSVDPYQSIIMYHRHQLKQGRLIVRYSGTEPLLRISVEAPTYEEALTIGTVLSQQLADALTKESV